MADNKKLREKAKKEAAAIKQKQQDFQNERKGRMVKVAEEHKSLLERANKAIQDGNTEQAKGLKERASHFAKVLNGTGRQLSNSYLKSILESSEQQDLDSKQNLDSVRHAIEKQTEEFEKSSKEAAAFAQAQPLLKPLEALNKKIELSNKAEVAREKLGQNALGKRLRDLGSAFGKAASKSDMLRAKELQEQYAIADQNLQKAMAGGNDEEIKLAQEQVDRLDETVKSEEDRREQTKKADEANSLLARISTGVEDFGSKLGGFLKGGSILGGLIGAALALFSPEKFAEIVRAAIEKVMTVVDFIKDLIEGDFTNAWETFKNNLGTFAIIIGGLLLYLGPGLITAASSLFGVVKTVGLFLRFTAFPALITGLTSLGTMMGFTAGTIGVIAAPVIAIIAALGLIYFGFKKLQDSLGPGAGILDTLKVAGLYFLDALSFIANAITFLPRKIFEFLGGGRLARWLFGDGAGDMADQFLGEGLDTNRGRTAQNEIRQRNEEEAEIARLQALEDARNDQTAATLTDPNNVANLGAVPNIDMAALNDALAQAGGGATVGVSTNNIAQDNKQITQVIDQGISQSNSALAIN
jgi:hypothetical protein